jgi:diguanylate cyclase (GGDEF)-like protein
MIRRILSNIEKLPRTLLAAAAALFVLLIGYFDFRSGDLSFSIFYVVPIAVLSWYGNRGSGTALASMATAVWLAGDLFDDAGRIHWDPRMAWNVPVAFLFFLLVVQLVSELRDSQRKLEDLARRDPLTDLPNRRAFLETAEMELARARRNGRPLTLAYMDLDGFKRVNDAMGHETGDLVLKKTATVLRENIRITDTAVRLGGDEFALLLPETERVQARIVIAKLRERLLCVMAENHWPVTASIGSVTCLTPPSSIDALISAADNLMYGVKSGGKNGAADSELA